MDLNELVRNIGVRRIMRIGQLVSLLVVYAVARLLIDNNDDIADVITVLIVLLITSEFVRVGHWLSFSSLRWAGYISRFAALGWAGLSLVALVIDWLLRKQIQDDVGVVALWAVAVVSLAVTVYSFTWGRSHIIVRIFTLGGDRTDNKLRITTLTDLHFGDYVSIEHIRKSVELSNEQSPDIVVLLGDYVDDDGMLAGELVGELTKLQAKLGVYAVLGNHDVFANESENVVEHFTSAQGITLLRNSESTVSFELNGQTKQINLIGIEGTESWWNTESNDLAASTLERFARNSKSDLTIVACHHPDVLDQCAAFDVDLVLAGHTHGGQLASPIFPSTFNVGRLAAKYVQGFYEIGDTKLIVSSGIGVGVIPARIAVPPEVSLIEITLD